MSEVRIKAGDIFESCKYHPVLCTEVKGDNVAGISLIDGSYPNNCSLKHCGVTKMSLQLALQIKQKGPANLDVRKSIKDKWWPEN